MSKIAEKATTDTVRDIFELVTLFDGGEDLVILPDIIQIKMVMNIHMVS